MQRFVPDHCPACGAPQRDDGSRHCHYCHAPRVPIGTPDPRHSRPCASCHHHVADGMSFCPHCGAAMASAPAVASDLGCPACGDEAGAMGFFGVSPSHERPSGHAVHGCRRCGGVWVDVKTFQALVADAGRQVVDEGRVERRQMPRRSQAVVYRKCPACQQQMQRRNFGRVSGIILDQCPHHGTFLDAGELPAVVEFIRSGGMALAERVEQRERAWEAGQRKQIRDMEARTQGNAMGASAGAEAAAFYGWGEAEPASLVDQFASWLTRAINRNW